MSRLLGATLVLVALATPAAAQNMDMPNPREMHGRARGDGAVAPGSIQVRVIQGEISKNAPAGHPVSWVHVGLDGKVEKTVAGVDTNGRATFSNLSVDRDQAYYALTLLGDDRLESDLVAPTKMIGGMRMMLVGSKLDKDGKPEKDHGPYDDALVEVGPAAQPPPGEAFVVVLGAQDVEVELVEIPLVGQPEKVIGKAKTQPAGNNQHIARFSGIASGQDHVYYTRLVHKGRPYFSKPFQMSEKAGAGRSALVLDKPILSAHLAAELDDAVLRFQIQYNLQNWNGMPVDTGSDGIALPMPEGSVGGQAGDENSHNVKVNPGVSATWRGILMPGANTFIIAFSMPVKDGRAEYRQQAPLGFFETMVVVEKSPGTQLDVGDNRVIEQKNDQGRQFYVVPRIDVRPGEQLTFTVSGLPQARESEKWARILVGALVMLVLVGAVGLTILTTSRRAAPAAGATSRRKQLTAEREKLYDKLVDIEKKRARLDGDDYASERQAVVTRLTLVLRELEQLDASA